MQEKLSYEDMKILKFLSEYKMLKVEDARLIYKTKRYYRQRVNRLINNEYVKRYKSYIIIDKKGREILGKVGSLYIKNIKNESYMERLKYIASIATITIDSNVKFIPSWQIKEKDKFTETARRYIGKIIIKSKEYLVYFISAKKEHIYIKQILFDVKKSINNNDIIIFVDDLNVICKKYYNLSLGKNNTYIILNNESNKIIFKNYNTIDIHELVERIYNQEILISDWDKADYLLEDNTYIVVMPFINTEKIENINWYYNENTDSIKKVKILTLKENEEKIKEIISNKCEVTSFDKNLLGGICEFKEFKEDII